MADAVNGHSARGWLGQLKADVRELAQETTGLFKQLKTTTTISKRSASLLGSGATVALIGTIFLCLTIVHVLAWAFPAQPIWLWYGCVALVLLIAGGILLAIGRRELNAFNAVQQQSQLVAHEAKETVDHVGEAVRSVRDSVQQTADSVRKAVNVRHQYDKRPWAMLAGAAAAGYLGGKLLKSDAPAPRSAPGADGAPKRRVRTRPRRVKRFEPELAQLKGLALGTLFGMVRDAATRSAPPRYEGEIKNMIDGITEKMGGTPIATPDGATGEPRRTTRATSSSQRSSS